MKILLCAVTLPLFLVGCANVAEKPTITPTAFTTNGASTVAFHDLRIENTNALCGNLTRLGRNPVHFGHVDYTITDHNGKVVQSGQTDYSGAIKQRRSANVSRFAIPLQQTWQAGQHATLTWHDQPHTP